MGTRSHKAALVDVFDIAVFVFLGGIDDDIVDKPAVDIGAVAGEIKTELWLFSGPFLHVEGK